MIAPAPCAVTPAADAMARLLVRAVIGGRSPRKLLKVVWSLRAAVDEMEATATACANVYHIFGHGQPVLGHPADLELQTAAAALKVAIFAEVQRAMRAEILVKLSEPLTISAL
jgi:hypothetical protein